MVAAILVLLFFVTSADSGALVVNYLTANTEDTPAWATCILGSFNCCIDSVLIISRWFGNSTSIYVS